MAPVAKSRVEAQRQEALRRVAAREEYGKRCSEWNRRQSQTPPPTRPRLSPAVTPIAATTRATRKKGPVQSRRTGGDSNNNRRGMSAPASGGRRADPTSGPRANSSKPTPQTRGSHHARQSSTAPQRRKQQRSACDPIRSSSAGLNSKVATGMTGGSSRRRGRGRDRDHLAPASVAAAAAVRPHPRTSRKSGSPSAYPGATRAAVARRSTQASAHQVGLRVTLPAFVSDQLQHGRPTVLSMAASGRRSHLVSQRIATQGDDRYCSDDTCSDRGSSDTNQSRTSSSSNTDSPTRLTSNSPRSRRQQAEDSEAAQRAVQRALLQAMSKVTRGGGCSGGGGGGGASSLETSLDMDSPVSSHETTSIFPDGQRHSRRRATDDLPVDQTDDDLESDPALGPSDGTRRATTAGQRARDRDAEFSTDHSHAIIDASEFWSPTDPSEVGHGGGGGANEADFEHVPRRHNITAEATWLHGDVVAARDDGLAPPRNASVKATTLETSDNSGVKRGRRSRRVGALSSSSSGGGGGGRSRNNNSNSRNKAQRDINKSHSRSNNNREQTGLLGGTTAVSGAMPSRGSDKKRVGLLLSREIHGGGANSKGGRAKQQADQARTQHTTGTVRRRAKKTNTKHKHKQQQHNNKKQSVPSAANTDDEHYEGNGVIHAYSLQVLQRDMHRAMQAPGGWDTTSHSAHRHDHTLQGADGLTERADARGHMRTQVSWL
jgi:hypothetical protein